MRLVNERLTRLVGERITAALRRQAKVGVLADLAADLEDLEREMQSDLGIILDDVPVDPPEASVVQDLCRRVLPPDESLPPDLLDVLHDLSKCGGMFSDGDYNANRLLEGAPPHARPRLVSILATCPDDVLEHLMDVVLELGSCRQLDPDFLRCMAYASASNDEEALVTEVQQPLRNNPDAPLPVIMAALRCLEDADGLRQQLLAELAAVSSSAVQQQQQQQLVERGYSDYEYFPYFRALFAAALDLWHMSASFSWQIQTQADSM